MKPTSLRLLVLASAALLFGCSKPAPVSLPETGGAPAPLKIRLKMDWYPQAEHGGFYEAVAKGYYRDAGLDVTIIPGGPGVLVQQLMAAGQADVAVERSDDVAVFASKGLPFVLICAYMEQDPQAILVHDESPVRGFADLNGRTIMGVPGSNWIEYIKAHYHIDFQLIPSNFGIAQFMADKDFIQQCFVTNEPYYVRKNGAHPRTLLMSDSGFKPYRTLFTTKSFAAAHPAELKAFVAATIRGWNDFMNEDPAPAKALILKANPSMTVEFMDYSIQAMRDSHLIEGHAELGDLPGLVTRKRLESQVADLVQLKMIPQLIPVDSFARFDLLPDDLRKKAE